MYIRGVCQSKTLLCLHLLDTILTCCPTPAVLHCSVQVEYKYIVLGGEQEEKDVVEWQPCFNMALLAEKEEVTVRDVWEGDCHEVLEGEGA